MLNLDTGEKLPVPFINPLVPSVPKMGRQFKNSVKV